MTISITIHTNDKAAKVVLVDKLEGKDSVEQENHVEPNGCGTFHVTDTRSIVSIAEVAAEVAADEREG